MLLARYNALPFRHPPGHQPGDSRLGERPCDMGVERLAGAAIRLAPRVQPAGFRRVCRLRGEPRAKAAISASTRWLTPCNGSRRSPRGCTTM
ncbi:MAG: hypothetical protein R2834_04275 [Rhodothermales bacterium]